MPYALDLFCGAGGMSEGLIQAGFHILFSSDISEDVEKTYINRHIQLGLINGHNTYFHRGDINNLNGEYIWEKIRGLEIFEKSIKEIPKEIDAIFGGPPCQGFSRAGRRDIRDPRNLLFKEYLRIIKDIKPKYVVMENVQGFNDTKFSDFVGITNKKYAGKVSATNILIKEFKLLGYNVLKPKILDASDYGVPQRRKRVIFIAYRIGLIAPEYPAPIVSEDNRVTVQDAISDLISNRRAKDKYHNGLTNYQVESIIGRTSNINGELVHSNDIYHNMELTKHQDIVRERFSLFSEGENGVDLRKRITSEGIDISKCKKLINFCSDELNISTSKVVKLFRSPDITSTALDVLLTKKNMRTRLLSNKPSQTIVTLPDDYISPFEDRIFTVREMARLQSFDDSFIFLSKRTTGGSRRKSEVPQYSQVGNAVPPLLARAVALEIKKALNRK